MPLSFFRSTVDDRDWVFWSSCFERFVRASLRYLGPASDGGRACRHAAARECHSTTLLKLPCREKNYSVAVDDGAVVAAVAFFTNSDEMDLYIMLSNDNTNERPSQRTTNKWSLLSRTAGRYIRFGLGLKVAKETEANKVKNCTQNEQTAALLFIV
jgi:hypothetical protein